MDMIRMGLNNQSRFEMGILPLALSVRTDEHMHNTFVLNPQSWGIGIRIFCFYFMGFCFYFMDYENKDFVLFLF